MQMSCSLVLCPLCFGHIIQVNSFRCGQCGYVVPSEMVKTYFDDHMAISNNQSGFSHHNFVTTQLGSYMDQSANKVENYKRLKKKQNITDNFFRCQVTDILQKVQYDLQLSSIAIEDAFYLFELSEGFENINKTIVHLLACVYIALNNRREMFPFKEFVEYGKSLTKNSTTHFIMQKIMYVRKKTKIVLIPNKPEDYFPLVLSRIRKRLDIKDDRFYVQIEKTARNIVKIFPKDETCTKSPYLLGILFIYSAIRVYFKVKHNKKSSPISIREFSDILGISIHSLEGLFYPSFQTRLKQMEDVVKELFVIRSINSD